MASRLMTLYFQSVLQSCPEAPAIITFGDCLPLQRHPVSAPRHPAILVSTVPLLTEEQPLTIKFDIFKIKVL